MKRICINCGSSPGFDEVYKKEAKKLGQYLAKHNIGIVYGGSNVGLMGEVADAALSEGGEVTGVIPKLIAAKVGHKKLTKLFEVDTMHQRKQKMFDLSDAFIALPGGIGTLEEILELLTWAQLGLHKKPCGFLNVADYYSKFFNFIDYAVEKGFMKQVHRDMIIKENSVENIIKAFQDYCPPSDEKWIM
jgi:uncharacterized protein (TIGR00730 family)